MLLDSVEVNVDIDINFTNGSIQSVHCNQYENSVRSVICHIQRNGETWSIPIDASIYIRITSPESVGTYIKLDEYGCTINDTRDTIEFVINDNITYAFGRHTCNFEFIIGEERFYSNNFYINVHRSALQDDTMKQCDDYRVLTDMINDIKIDDKLSETSENTVQNKVITKKFKEIESIDRWTTVYKRHDSRNLAYIDWSKPDYTSLLSGDISCDNITITTTDTGFKVELINDYEGYYACDLYWVVPIDIISNAGRTFYITAKYGAEAYNWYGDYHIQVFLYNSTPDDPNQVIYHWLGNVYSPPNVFYLPSQQEIDQNKYDQLLVRVRPYNHNQGFKTGNYFSYENIQIEFDESTEYVPPKIYTKLSTVNLDDELLETSENAIQNKAVTTKINELEETINNIPIQEITIDTDLSETSENPVQNKIITSKLNEVFQSVSDGKSLVASAITDKGVETTNDATFEIMANNIRSISSSNGEIVAPSNVIYDLTYTCNVEESNNYNIGISCLLYTDSSNIIDVYVNDGEAITKTINSVDSVCINTVIMTVSLTQGDNTIRIVAPSNDIGITSVSLLRNESLPALTSNETGINGLIYRTSASSVYPSATECEAYMPFNRTDSYGEKDCWHPDYGAPQWLLLELPYPSIINSFTMYNRTSHIECPNEVMFQGSNDGEIFYNIKGFVFSTVSKSGLSKEVVINDDRTFKYFRWYLESVNSSYGVISKINIDDMDVMYNSEIIQRLA